MVHTMRFSSFILKILTAAVSILATLTFAFQAAADPSAAVARALESFHKAMRDGDAVQLEPLLSDQFRWTDEDGTARTKTEFLKLIGDAKAPFAELTTDQESRSEYHDVAVVTGRSARRQTTSSRLNEFRYTLTLVKVGRNWKVAAYHTSRLAPAAGQPLQVRLGYPADTKLLILNADDLAVSQSADVASFAALDNKFITSATVMVPCPWFTEVAAYAKAHPGADLGLHLTLTSE